MKAIVWTKYGSPDGLFLREIAKPTPKDDEILIKVYATTVTAGDTELRSSNFPLWLWLPIRIWMGVINPRNKILGQELAGEVEAVGKDVTSFKKGDQVFASAGFGAYAQYVCLPEKPQEMEGMVALKPINMTYDEAAAVPIAGLEALHFMRKGNIQRGEKLLINGAGGSIGTYALQLAKHFGAEVTCVDSANKLDMLRSMGTDHVIDYSREDFTTNGETYDAILDVVGKSSFSRSIGVLKENGRYLLANPRMSHMLRGAWISRNSSKKVIFGGASAKAEDLLFLKQLIEAGEIKAIIDRRYPFEQTADAHRYVDTGQKRGNVVITVQHA
jgi:NADPH:quinone reductase-like Zn-dependent oxidoreductase